MKRERNERPIKDADVLRVTILPNNTHAIFLLSELGNILGIFDEAVALESKLYRHQSYGIFEQLEHGLKKEQM